MGVSRRSRSCATSSSRPATAASGQWRPTRRETIPCASCSAASATTACLSRTWWWRRTLGDDPNEGGRVEPGLYAAGWIKRGPSGVIGTNKKDATETVELLLADARAGLRRREGGRLEALLSERGVEPVLYEGWEAIDAVERAAGEPLGRPRVKLHLGRAPDGRPPTVRRCELPRHSSQGAGR